VTRRVVVIDREDIVAPFMRSLMKQEDAFTVGRGMGLAQIDDTGRGELLAGVWFDQFNGANMNMHVAARPNRRWMTREFLYAAFSYPFERCGVKRVTGLVDASNTDARRFDEHLGFELEATLKDGCPNGDLLVYRMMKNDCKWLRLKPHGAIK
jgi:RimJ/RimL family protein N-acetyltransferase